MMSEGSCGLRRSIYSNVSLVDVVLVLEAVQQYYAAFVEARTFHTCQWGMLMPAAHGRRRHCGRGIHEPGIPPVRSVTRELPRMRRIGRRRRCMACVGVLESVSET